MHRFISKRIAYIHKYGDQIVLQTVAYITKTRLYNFDPLQPHFYIVKLGFTGVYIIFLISAQNIDCGYSLEPPPRKVLTSTTIYVLSRNMKNIRVFHLKIFQFLEVKFSTYLSRRVFVMFHFVYMMTTFNIQNGGAHHKNLNKKSFKEVTITFLLSSDFCLICSKMHGLKKYFKESTITFFFFHPIWVQFAPKCTACHDLSCHKDYFVNSVFPFQVVHWK